MSTAIAAAGVLLDTLIGATIVVVTVLGLIAFCWFLFCACMAVWETWRGE